MIVTCPDCATRYRIDDAAFSAGGRAVRCNHCSFEWYQIGPSSPSNGRTDGPGGRAHGYDDELGEANIAPDAPTEAEAEAPARFDRADFDEEPGFGEAVFEESEFEEPDVAEDDGARSAVEDEDSGFTHTVPVVVDANDVRAMGAHPRRMSGGKRGSAVRGAVIAAACMAIAAPLGVYYLGPKLSERAPIADTTAPPRDPVDSVMASVRNVAGGSVSTEGIIFAETKYDLVERAEGPALEVWGMVANNGPEAELSPTIEVVSRDKGGGELQRWFVYPDIDELKPGESARFESRLMYPVGPVFDVDLYIVASQ